jgi:hypothetical protein
MLIRSISSNALTVVRARAGTTAAAATSGAAVTQVHAAYTTSTTIDADITASATTVSVADASAIAIYDYVKIANEAMFVTGIDTTTNDLTVVRGALSTTAATATSGATLDVQTMTNVATNWAATTIGADITNSATDPTLAVPGGLTLAAMFSIPSYVLLGSEQMLVTAVASTTQLTVVRAQLGTSAAAGTSGNAIVRQSNPAYTVPTTATTTLSADITSSATTVNVVDGSGIAANDFIQCNSEIMWVSAKPATNQLTVTRGVWGTTAVAGTGTIAGSTTVGAQDGDSVTKLTLTAHATTNLQTYASTTLDGAITATATRIKVTADSASTTTSASAFAAYDYVLVGTEVMQITSVDGNTLTVTRGALGTTAATAADDAAITRRTPPTAADTYASTTVATSAISATSTTTLNVAAGSTFAVNDYLMTGEEVMWVSAISTNALTVTRGALGTTALSSIAIGTVASKVSLTEYGYGFTAYPTGMPTFAPSANPTAAPTQ